MSLQKLRTSLPSLSCLSCLKDQVLHLCFILMKRKLSVDKWHKIEKEVLKGQVIMIKRIRTVKEHKWWAPVVGLSLNQWPEWRPSNLSARCPRAAVKRPVAISRYGSGQGREMGGHPNLGEGRNNSVSSNTGRYRTEVHKNQERPNNFIHHYLCFSVLPLLLPLPLTPSCWLTLAFIIERTPTSTPVSCLRRAGEGSCVKTQDSVSEWVEHGARRHVEVCVCSCMHTHALLFRIVGKCTPHPLLYALSFFLFNSHR